MGRTCLQDAVPMTLGQNLVLLLMLPNGCQENSRGTSKDGTNPASAVLVLAQAWVACRDLEQSLIKHLSDVCGRPIHTEEDLFDGMMATDELGHQLMLSPASPSNFSMESCARYSCSVQDLEPDSEKSICLPWLRDPLSCRAK